MHRRQHRADAFARSVFALLAGHRLISDARIVGRAFVITVNPDPVHLAAAAHFILAYDRHIVFGLTTEQAGRTAHAGAQVNDHSPFVLGVFVARPHALMFFGMRLAVVTFRLVISGEAQLPDKLAPFVAVVRLRLGELDVAAGLLDGDSARLVLKTAVGECDEWISVRADIAAHLARFRSAITDRDAHTIFVLSGLNVDGQFNRRRAFRQPHDIAIGQSHLFGQPGSDVDVIVPGDFGQRVGQFLQPRIGGARAVAQRDFLIKREVQFSGGFGAARAEAFCRAVQACGDERRRGRRRGLDHEDAVVQRAIPEFVEARVFGLLREKLLPPFGAQDFVIVARVAAPFEQALLPGARVEKRRDGRLRQTVNAARRVGVAPRFQKMRRRAYVIGHRRGLVQRRAERDLERNFVEAAQQGFVIVIAVDRIGADDDQRGHLPVVHLLDQVGHLLIAAACGRPVEFNRVAVIAKRVIDEVDRRLRVHVIPSADNQRFAAMLLQLFSRLLDRLAHACAQMFRLECGERPVIIAFRRDQFRQIEQRVEAFGGRDLDPAVGVAPGERQG
ncbi:MAG: hypothetical protein JMDDDDMK_03548 [Acidobacteria bacterium]|nr:hypothetical protein [Acidobacteriota bacterium]